MNQTRASKICPSCCTWTGVLVWVATMGGAGMLRAAPIAIDNFSFEASGLQGDTWTDVTPEWGETVEDSNGAFVENITGFASEGTHHLGINGIGTSIANGILPDGSAFYSVWQDLGEPLLPNTSYQLTVGIGHRTGYTFAGNQSVFALGLSDGTLLSSTTVDAWAITASTFADWSAIYETGANAPAGTIVVHLTNASPGDGRAHFDNIRLDATPVATGVPEGGSVLGAFGLAAAGLLFLRRSGRRR